MLGLSIASCLSKKMSKKKASPRNADWPCPKAALPPGAWRPKQGLAIDQHLVVGVVRALHHHAAELDRDILRGQRSGYTELEDPWGEGSLSQWYSIRSSVTM